MLDSGRSIIQDDKLIKQNFFLKFTSCIVIFFKLGPSILYMSFISFNFIQQYTYINFLTNNHLKSIFFLILF